MSHNGRILILDDEEAFLQTTSRVLKREGFSCIVATDARLALERMTTEPPIDLLLSDINVPGNTDLDFVREFPRLAPGVPVILITGYPTVETAQASIQLPVAAYMVKPVNPEKLIAEVSKAIEMGRLRRSVLDSRQLACEQLKEIEQLAAVLSDRVSPPLQDSMDKYIALSLRGVLESLAQMQSVVRLSGEPEKEDGEEVPSIAGDGDANHPAINLLYEATHILEKTKRAFKSKDLATLRQRIETFLDNHRNRPKV